MRYGRIIGSRACRASARHAAGMPAAGRAGARRIEGADLLAGLPARRATAGTRRRSAGRSGPPPAVLPSCSWVAASSFRMTSWGSGGSACSSMAVSVWTTSSPLPWLRSRWSRLSRASPASRWSPCSSRKSFQSSRARVGLVLRRRRSGPGRPRRRRRPRSSRSRRAASRRAPWPWSGGPPRPRRSGSVGIVRLGRGRIDRGLVDLDRLRQGRVGLLGLAVAVHVAEPGEEGQGQHRAGRDEDGPPVALRVVVALPQGRGRARCASSLAGQTLVHRTTLQKRMDSCRKGTGPKIKGLVRLGGLEPPTKSLGNSCSVHLSYSRRPAR